MAVVEFEYLTGVSTPLFDDALLAGSWDDAGRWCSTWSTVRMEPFHAEDGCPAFRARVELDPVGVGHTFAWGVEVNAGTGVRWGIPTELNGALDTRRQCEFTLGADGGTERYYLTHSRRLGANKVFLDDAGRPAISFAAWAPNASTVEVVLGDRESGYIADDGAGITAQFPMRPNGGGVWETDAACSPELAAFADFDHVPYMFRLRRTTVASRTAPTSTLAAR